MRTSSRSYSRKAPGGMMPLFPGTWFVGFRTVPASPKPFDGGTWMNWRSKQSHLSMQACWLATSRVSRVENKLAQTKLSHAHNCGVFHRGALLIQGIHLDQAPSACLHGSHGLLHTLTQTASERSGATENYNRLASRPGIFEDFPVCFCPTSVHQKSRPSTSDQPSNLALIPTSLHINQ